MSALNALLAVLAATWNAFFLAAPFVLFGLLIGGVLHVLVSQRTLARWMGGRGLASAARAALLGIPLPICSCGIVPIAIALRRKGASRPACLAFLITTPESSADAVLLTWGMLGPFVAVARLVAALATAVVTAVLAIAFPEPEPAPSTGRLDGEPAAEGSVDGRHHDHEAGHAHDHGAENEAPDYVGGGALWRTLRGSWRRLANAIDPEGPPPSAAGGGADDSAAAGAVATSSAIQTSSAVQTPLEAPPAAAASAPSVEPPAVRLASITRGIARYAFIELLDDIVFWLALGLLLSGAIAALLPANLLATGAARGLGAMLLALVVGIPMYVCASASTPVAAALVAKGVSPGAALVFLLVGPATNVATIVLLARHFGRRFLRVYLAGVIGTAVVCGLLLDALVSALGLQVNAQLASQSEGVPAFLELLCALALLGLMVWRLWAGAGRRGLRDLGANLRNLAARAGMRRLPLGGSRRWPWLSGRRLFAGAAAAAVLLWLCSGFTVVPPDAAGYSIVFGRAIRRDLPPGLHWVPPPPIGRCDVWRVRYPRKADVGFRTDLAMLAQRRELARNADPAQWHSPVAAMNTNLQDASYLTGDENLLELSFTVHYALSLPFPFFYEIDNEHDIVSVYAQAAAREFVATRTLDELLTASRRELEKAIGTTLQQQMVRLGTGVKVASVHVVDLHPPQEVVAAFRDVSSAREDRETRIHTALAGLAKEAPLARGAAAQALAGAQAAADSARTLAGGNADGFTARAAAISAHRELLRDLLWLEAAEKVLAGRRKFIVPPGAAGSRVVLWPDQAPATPLKLSGED